MWCILWINLELDFRAVLVIPRGPPKTRLMAHDYSTTSIGNIVFTWPGINPPINLNCKKLLQVVPSQICEIISRALALNLWLGFLVHRADVESFLLLLETSRLAKFICLLMKGSTNYYKFQSDKLKSLVFQLISFFGSVS